MADQHWHSGGTGPDSLTGWGRTLTCRMPLKDRRPEQARLEVSSVGYLAKHSRERASVAREGRTDLGGATVRE